MLVLIETKRADNWSLGANNMTPVDRIPAGFVRSAVNMEPAGANMSLRSGFEKIYSGTNVRAVFAHASSLVIADGDTLFLHDPFNGQSAELTTIAETGAIAGASLNRQLYISTALGGLRVDGGAVKAWGIEAPQLSVELVPGALSAGMYNVALVAIGDDGEESGAVPYTVKLNGNQAIRLSSTSTGALRMYCSPVNSSTLYGQGRLYGPTLITSVQDDSATLMTAHMMPMPPVTQMVSHHSVMAGCSEKYVFVTEPMQPHLVNYSRGFFQYGSNVQMIASTDGGLYVSDESRTYFISGVETDQPAQREVADFPAVHGSAVKLPDGRAAWFTRYGQAIGDSTGAIVTPNRVNYAPELANIGSAGVLEHNGNQMVVTTMRGPTKANRLAAGDFCEVEITDER